MRVYLYEDRAGRWHWRLKSGAGKTLADSGEGYITRAGAIGSLERFAQLSHADICAAIKEGLSKLQEASDASAAPSPSA